MKEIVAKQANRIELGKQGEHLVRKVSFREPTLWAEEFGPGTVQLIVQPPGQGTPYPVILTEENGHYVWNITKANTAIPGTGACELYYRARAEDAVVKSSTYSTYVVKALEAKSDSPIEPQQSYLEQIIQAGADALEAAELAKSATVSPPKLSKTSTWMVWNVEQNGYIDTKVSAIGPQGIPGEQGAKGDKGDSGLPSVTLDEVNLAIDTAISVAMKEAY